jgi:capsular polysaccharide export protein
MAVRPGARLPFALPPAIPGRPEIAHGCGDAPPGAPPDPALLRAERLFWPVPRHDAITPAAAVIVDPAAPPARTRAQLALARAMFGADACAIAPGRAGALAGAEGWTVVSGLAAIRPDALLRLAAGPGAAPLFWAALAGLDVHCLEGDRLSPVDPAPWAARLRWTDPWTGAPTGMARGLDAAIAFRRAAEGNDRQAFTVGLSRWKRRCAAPFLQGPAGPPRHLRSLPAAQAAAAATGGRVVLWGTRDAGAPDVLRLEDGFVRSVGLGLRHAPPASLAAAVHGLHFDCTRIGDLERAAKADMPPALLVRAACLRARMTAEGVTKYNLPARACTLPDTARPRLLVVGQVEGDASLQWGAPGVRRNGDLLHAARACWPDAFILWRPHPDVETGLRPGRPDAIALACADASASDAPAEACLAWADRVVCMTSLMGFEALLRGVPVTTFGRPFYAGWGLTQDLSPALPHPAPVAALTGPPLPPRGRDDPPFSRGQALALDALVAAALILHPRDIDPGTGLPATPERLLDAIAADRAAAGAMPRRLRTGLRNAASWLLNRLG